MGDQDRETELQREDIVTGLQKMNAYLAGQGAFLLADSPAALKSRNLYVPGNALDRL